MSKPLTHDKTKIGQAALPTYQLMSLSQPLTSSAHATACVIYLMVIDMMVIDLMDEQPLSECVMDACMQRMTMRGMPIWCLYGWPQAALLASSML